MRNTAWNQCLRLVEDLWKIVPAVGWMCCPQESQEYDGRLGVVTSQVADTADGRTADGSVVAMMVVEMQPVSKRSGSLAV